MASPVDSSLNPEPPSFSLEAPLLVSKRSPQKRDSKSLSTSIRSRISKVRVRLPRAQRMSIMKVYNPYQEMSDRIRQVHFTDEYEAYRMVTVDGKTYRGKHAGQNRSFTTFEMTHKDVTLLFRVFNFTSLKFRSSFRGKPQSNQLRYLHGRISWLTVSYNLAIHLKIPVAKILNLWSIKNTGLIIQENYKPLVITYQSRDSLTDREQDLLDQFFKILRLTQDTAASSWDLTPERFVVDSKGQIRLRDFPDQPRDNAPNMERNFAVREWTQDNPAAKGYMALNLFEMMEI